jgi:5-hydroxyisourate hydrolase
VITTHVLDTARGKPAAGVPIELELQQGGAWQRLGQGATDNDGRLRTLVPHGHELQAGIYRISFDTKAYFKDQPSFFPEVRIVFEIHDPKSHYHVPLLLSPFGYSTYRGS